jgi:uncharacterized protein YbaP (TraB family)
MKKAALALFAALVFAVPALAADDAQSEVIQAHPVAWHVHTGHSEITLFGSMHMLPANMAWLTPDILHSIKTSDVFVFEVPTDDISRTTLTRMVDARGALPAGQSLRAMLPPESQADFDAAMEAEHMSASVTDRQQPWLASLHLTLADTMNRKFFPDAGVDYVVMSWANDRHREVRYLETVNDQLAMLVPDPSETGDQLNRFQAALKRVGQEEKDLDPLLAAWSSGDVATMDTMISSDFQDRPAARKRLLTDRNREWAEKIKQMAGEWRNFFIVVGAAHLTGPDGVIALLRKEGFQVDGP